MHRTLRSSMGVACAVAALVTSMVSPGASECSNPVLLGAPLPYLTGPNPLHMVARDFNEDGRIDFAITNGDLSAGSPNASLAVLIGTGNRTYAAPVLYPLGRLPIGLVSEDFNEDGILDLATADKSSDSVSVLIGLGTAGVGNGTFAPAVSYGAGSGPFELVAADFNGDGIVDLATCLNGTGGVCILPGLGSGGVGNGTFGAPVTVPVFATATGLATGDFNHDAIPDLAVTQNVAGQIAVLLGTGNAVLGPGSFQAAAYYAAGPLPFHIHVADFNEDGVQDLAVANTNSGGIDVMLGLPNGTFTHQATLPSGNSSTVTSGDFNHDGILDLVTGTVTGVNTGQAELFLGQGAGGVGNGTFQGTSPYASGGDVYQVIAGDFDGDGSTDVLASQGYGNYVALLPGTCAEAAPDPRAPVLTDVRDVPNDNGGRVFLTWTASTLDVSGGPVNNYRVWRRIPPALAIATLPTRLASREVIAVPASDAQIVYWEALATLPAQRLPGYGYTAATTQDSMPQGNPYTAFFVSALTSNLDVFYSSDVDSGYSVDNLPPHGPAGLTGAVMASGFSLEWEPCPDADVYGYRVYRGASADFVPSQASLVASPHDPSWIDPSGHGEWYYKLSAIDVHTNESGYALLDPNALIGVDHPAVFALQGARPNPSRDGRLSVAFALARGPGARLEVVDLAGRRVVTRDLSAFGPGAHAVTVGEETPLPSGVYFLRLLEQGRVAESKAVVTR